MSYLKYSGIDVQIAEITNADISICQSLLESASIKQIFILKELIAEHAKSELLSLLEANTDFNPGLYNNGPKLPKTPAVPTTANSNKVLPTGNSLTTDQQMLNDMLKDNQVEVVSTNNSMTKVKYPDGKIRDVPTSQLDKNAIEQSTANAQANVNQKTNNQPDQTGQDVQSNQRNQTNSNIKKDGAISYALNQFRAGKTPGGTFSTAGDGKGLMAGAMTAAANWAGKALRDSVESEAPDEDVLEEMGEIVRLAGINGKNQNCAGSKAVMPSIIGNTSDSHRPTVKLGHELRKERVAKERKKDNKFKKD